MIARLHGKLVESAYTMCVIDACGVGYEAAIPLSTFDKLPRCGEPVGGPRVERGSLGGESGVSCPKMHSDAAAVSE